MDSVTKALIYGLCSDKTNLNLLSNYLQVNWVLNDGIIIWVLHFGRKLLEKFADDTSGRFSVRYHSIKKLLQNFL